MTIIEFAKDAEIRSLTVTKLEYELVDEEMRLDSSCNYSFSPVVSETSITQKTRDLIVHFPMQFTASIAPDSQSSNDDEPPLFTLKVEYKIVFRSQKRRKVTEQLKEGLFDSVIPRIVHPYFRQDVAVALQRVGLPPLQLPLLEKFEDTDTTQKAESLWP
ncbi:MAG TPA: protein-export chaperone SecB [Sphaerochaeta sp.]|nr:protein-export chaperone SecB [Sphaerochaeta sp.]